MKKISNDGWSLATFTALLGTLFVALLVVVFLTNYFDTGLSKNDSNIIYDEKPIIEYNYEAYENTLVDYARAYKVDNDLILVDGAERNIDIDKLMVPGTKYSHCAGYVRISRQGLEEIYQAFIDCGSYRTPGF